MTYTFPYTNSDGDVEFVEIERSNASVQAKGMPNFWLSDGRGRVPNIIRAYTNWLEFLKAAEKFLAEEATIEKDKKLGEALKAAYVDGWANRDPKVDWIVLAKAARKLIAEEDNGRTSN